MKPLIGRENNARTRIFRNDVLYVPTLVPVLYKLEEKDDSKDEQFRVDRIE